MLIIVLLFVCVFQPEWFSRQPSNCKEMQNNFERAKVYK